MSWTLPIFAQEVAAGGSRQYVEALVIGILFFVVMNWIGGRMATTTDRPWLQRYVAWAYLTKLAGSLVRFWMVTVLYGTGDSEAYQVAGETFAGVWRGLAVPVSDAGGQGTAFTELATGLIYAIYTPTLLGGFLIFATLAFLGQILFYSAFRRWFGAEKQKLYALAVLFFPSLVFWPSSVGKDALMVLFLGLAAYGASLLLHDYKLISIPVVGVGLALAAGIRPHVAGMFAIALVLALLFGKPLPNLRGSPMRPILLVMAAGAAALVLVALSSTFQVGIERTTSTSDLTGFLEDVSERTGDGGSEIEGIAISTPSQLPMAAVTVLFRPLLHEGTNMQVIVSALEGTALLGLVIWKLPAMWRNKGLLRQRAYLTMCLFYTGGFILGFSAILNLGILTRQRVQLLPFFLAIVVALGWPEPDDSVPAPEDDLRSGTIPPPPPRVPGYAASRRDGLGTTAGPLQGTPESLKSTVPGPPPGTRSERNVSASVADEKEPELPPPRRRETKGKHVQRPVRDRVRPEVIELRSADPEMSIREIARKVDASPTTVRRVLVEHGLN